MLGTGYLPAGMYDRPLNDELVVNYLQTAHAERAWFLRRDSGYMQRWHARCIASSDFAAILDPQKTPYIICGKRRSIHDRHSCACGAPVEDTQHVHLHCPLYANFRQPFFALLDSFTARVNATNPENGQIRSREEALHWIHHDSPLVLAFYNNPLVLSEQDGDALRHAALIFHSRVQQQRYSTGNAFRAQQQQVEYLVEAEHAHLLAPFTASHAL